jgi:hypothetical protein
MREAAIWLTRTDLLPQYSLAKEMIGILPRDEPKTLTEAERGGMMIAE